MVVAAQSTLPARPPEYLQLSGRGRSVQERLRPTTALAENLVA